MRLLVGVGGELAFRLSLLEEFFGGVVEPDWDFLRLSSASSRAARLFIKYKLNIFLKFYTNNSN